MSVHPLEKVKSVAHLAAIMEKQQTSHKVNDEVSLTVTGTVASETPARCKNLLQFLQAL